MSNCSYFKSRNGNNNTVRRYTLWLTMFVKIQNGCQYCTNRESKPMWIFVHRQKNIYLTMFGSSLPPVVCRRTNVLLTFFCLFVYGGVQHMFYCVCLHLAFCVPNVASSLNCPFLISCSVFSNVYLPIPTMCLLSPLFSYPMTWRFCFLRRSNHYFKIVVTVDTLRVPELRFMDMICRMGCR